MSKAKNFYVRYAGYGGGASTAWWEVGARELLIDGSVKKAWIVASFSEHCPGAKERATALAEELNAGRGTTKERKRK